jgi:hypothetical protein
MKRFDLKLVGLLVLATAALPAAARADLYSTAAFDNGTIQSTGPRQGDFGKIFFNIEGLANSPFDSYGVADFDSTQLGINFTVSNILTVTVALTQDNAAFTTNGSINFYISGDTVTSIQPADDVVFFDESDPEGLNGQLSPTYYLGTGTFTEIANGTEDDFTFALDPTSDVYAYLINQINNGGVVRLVITPNDPDVSATYAGFSNVDYNGPVLTVDAYP